MSLERTHFADGLVLDFFPEDTIIGGQIKQSGALEPYEEQLLLSYIVPGDEVIDIGANIGVYTLQMARAAGESGKVYAFEPEPTNFALLEHNIQENGLSTVELFPLALGDKKSRATMYLSWDNIGDHRIYDADYRRSRKTVEVTVNTLDNILFEKSGKISVIKSDTQGYEPFVIRGARNIIQRDLPVIMMEYWPFGMKKAQADSEEMLNFLEEYYTGFIIEGKKRHLYPLDRIHLNDFTKLPGNEEGHVNLLFVP